MSDLRHNLTTALWVAGIATVVLALMTFGTALDAWTAWRGESEHVTGAAATRVGDQLYVTVSGYAERSSRGSDARHSTVFTDFPRLSSYRASDGELVARRQYAPVLLRFSYVDTVVRTLTAAEGRVWVVSTEPGVGLHAVDPVTLDDVIDAAGLVARVPAMAAGMHIDNGTIESPVTVEEGALVLRLETGAWLALDPTTVTARPRGDAEDEPRGDRPTGDATVEKLVRGRPDALEPAVLPVFTADGAVDRSASFVITQTSLNREAARVKVSRWDTSGGAPVAGWTTQLDDVPPACCQRQVWRADGLAIVWYEDWLVALDDATGAVRWIRRL